MALYVNGVRIAEEAQRYPDDIHLGFGAGDEAKFLWETADPNANVLMLVLPEGGAVDVPVFVVGDASIANADLGWFNGITEPSLAIVDDDKDSYIVLGWLTDDKPYIYPGGLASTLHIKQLLSVHDGSEPTWGHSPTGLAVEGIVEIDGAAYLDGGLNTTTISASGDLSAVGGFKQGYVFMQINVAASQSAVALDVSGLAGNTEIVMPYAGSVLAISIASNAARAGGTLTVDVTINGVATGLQAVLDATNTTYHRATQAKDTDTFAAGDRLGVKITTDASWTPTTADIVVAVLVEM